MGKKKNRRILEDEVVEIAAEIKKEKTVAMVKLYGPVNEEGCEEVIESMLKYTYSGGDLIQFIISTTGGLASEMFSVYDIMRSCRESCVITTLGLGKVMSAGVLLLAAGTEGSRQIGENCKVMIHGIRAEQGGSISSMESDLENLSKLQERYIKVLSRETNMSKRYIKKLFNKKLDVYFTAEEAVELGIADEVI